MKKLDWKPTLQLRWAFDDQDPFWRMNMTLEQKFVAVEFKRTDKEVLEIQHEEWREIPTVAIK